MTCVGVTPERTAAPSRRRLSAPDNEFVSASSETTKKGRVHERGTVSSPTAFCPALSTVTSPGASSDKPGSVTITTLRFGRNTILAEPPRNPREIVFLVLKFSIPPLSATSVGLFLALLDASNG